MEQISEYTVIVRILISLALGGIIGVEREMKNRPAGFRTYMLVCVGSCIIMMTNVFAFQQSGVGDPVRMSAQVISGIGFLGAGTIVVTRYNRIRGLTTAAGLWTSAAVGLAVGIGFYCAAIIGGGAVFAVMTLFQHWDSRMQSSSRVLEVYVEISKDVAIGDFLRSMRELELDVSDIQMMDKEYLDCNIKAFIATLKLKSREKHIYIMRQINALKGVEYLEEI